MFSEGRISGTGFSRPHFSFQPVIQPQGGNLQVIVRLQVHKGLRINTMAKSPQKPSPVHKGYKKSPLGEFSPKGLFLSFNH